MRVAIIVVDDVIYQPKVYSKLIPQLQHPIVGMGLVPIIPFKYNPVKYIYHHVNLFGFFRFGLKGCMSLLIRAYSWLHPRLPNGNFASMTRLAESYRIPVIRAQSVNAPEFVEAMRALQPDLIISSCTHIYRKAIIDVPRIGIINTHAARLPLYRGVYPVFWAMLNNETSFGITVHFINEKIDEGQIILQKNYPLNPDDTFEGLLGKIVDETPALVLEAIQRIETGSVAKGEIRPLDKGAYYSFPTRAEVARFKSLGRRIA